MRQPLSEKRLRFLLASFPALRIGVVGDFFLDAYFDCDPRLNELSLETGKTCYQVVRLRRQAGAAGTVAANLSALGVGHIAAVGFCGDDGEGYELRRSLHHLGLDLEGFFVAPHRFTPTYGKPCYIDPTRRHKPVVEELERLDIKNRRPTPLSLQEKIIAHICHHLTGWDALLLLDQVSLANCGVLTSRLRRFITSQVRQRPGLFCLADSRHRIGLFRHMLIKPNRLEAARALGYQAPLSLRASAEHARLLCRRTRRPVFLTLGEKGMLVAQGDRVDHLPAFPVDGPVDPVGAGDSCSAALVAALAGGATLIEAALLGTLAASVTVQQIGTTGTASPRQILRRYREVRHGL
jgi:rfaE bifunctional protein kinase chain/domain